MASISSPRRSTLCFNGAICLLRASATVLRKIWRSASEGFAAFSLLSPFSILSSRALDHRNDPTDNTGWFCLDDFLHALSARRDQHPPRRPRIPSRRSGSPHTQHRRTPSLDTFHYSQARQPLQSSLGDRTERSRSRSKPEEESNPSHVYEGHEITLAHCKAGRPIRRAGRLALKITYKPNHQSANNVPQSQTFLLTDEECLLLSLDLLRQVHEHFPHKS